MKLHERIEKAGITMARWFMPAMRWLGNLVERIRFKKPPST